MGFEEDCSVKCSMEYCSAGAKDEAIAAGVGWEQVENKFYCPLHAPTAVRTARLLGEIRRLRLRAEELQRSRANQIAKKYLTAADYRAWDQFQGDLADYHRNTGNLAPQQLRSLSPQDWHGYYRKNGRIDVQATADELIEAERKANATREWILRRDLG